jgi:outer membrane protein assembly factor BamB
VFGSCAAAIHAIDAADGRVIRKVDLGPDSQVAGGVALSGERAYAGTRDGVLACVDLREGGIRWTNRVVSGELFTTPAVSADRVVTADSDGNVHGLRRTDGKTEWSADIGAGPATSPVIAGDKVVAAGGGSLFLLGLTDGKRIWSQPVSDATSGPAIVGRMIVIGGDDGMVSAFGEETP